MIETNGIMIHIDRLRPKLILYEHQHLANEDRSAAQQFLARHN